MPAAITYNALVSACEKGMKLGRAVERFDTMQQQSLAPDVLTLNALVIACEKGTTPLQALKLFNTMQH